MAKGLVDKGVLRTEKKSFVLFDMATHPLSDLSIKKKLIQKMLDALFSRGPSPDKKTISLVCAAYAANLLENVLEGVTFAQRESAYVRADELLKESANLSENAKSLGITEVVAGQVFILFFYIFYIFFLIKNSVLGVFSKMDSIL